MSIYTETMDDLFFNAYIECALWSSIDDNGDPLDATLSVDSFAQETLDGLRASAIKFFTDNIELINRTPDGYSYGHAGHDLWLTQNGHGAGFWDGDAGEIGGLLTREAEKLGPIDLCVGDDGKIYA